MRVSNRVPEGRSHTRMVRSAEPEAIQSLLGDTAKHLTHPVCPAITLHNSHFPSISQDVQSREYERARVFIHTYALFGSSLMLTVKLNTGKSAVESESLQKYPKRWNWNFSST